MINIPSVSIKYGTTLPILAYGNGTALFGQNTTALVRQALDAGFPMIDTAQMYKNSQHVGEALSRGSGPKVKVVAKVSDLSGVREAALEERRLLGRECLDVLLLHSPSRGLDGLPTNVEAWKMMEQLKDDGVADVIGVSNWLASDIEEVLAAKPKHRIQINQIEHHPFLAGSDKQKKLLALQRREGIASMIYSALAPLTHGAQVRTSLLQVLDSIATREEPWTPATILFKWASQTASNGMSDGDFGHDGILITTSSKAERLPGYLSTFDSRRLTDEEIQQISDAGQQGGVHKFRMVRYFEGRAE